MSNAAFGRIDGDLFGRSLSIYAKLVLDEQCNLTVANATMQNTTIQDTLFVGKIFEEEALQGITFTGNVMVNPSYSIRTPHLLADLCEIDNLKEKTPGNGIVVHSNVCVDEGYLLKATKIDESVVGNGLIISNYLPYHKFGTGRAYLGNVHTIIEDISGGQIEFGIKSFESTNTTLAGLIHPSGNTTVTFMAPSVSEIGFEYGNVFVRVNTVLDVYFNNGSAGDEVIIAMFKNNTDILSEFVYTLPATLANVDQTIQFNDIVQVSPGGRIDIYARGVDNSTNLDAEIAPGYSTSHVSFEIISFEL